MSAYLVSVWLHILAATAWIGGMIFFAAVIVPTIRRPEMREQSQRLLAVVGPLFRRLGAASLILLVVTGVTNLWLRGIGWTTLTTGEFWRQSYGKLLGHKLALVVFVVLATGLHDTIANTMVEDPAARERARRRASMLGRVVLLASFVIVALAVGMVRGCG